MGQISLSFELYQGRSKFSESGQSCCCYYYWVEVAADVARLKFLLKGYHMQGVLTVDLVWKKAMSRSIVLDYLEKLLKEELLTEFSPK